MPSSLFFLRAAFCFFAFCCPQRGKPGWRSTQGAKPVAGRRHPPPGPTLLGVGEGGLLTFFPVSGASARLPCTPRVHPVPGTCRADQGCGHVNRLLPSPSTSSRCLCPCMHQRAENALSTPGVEGEGLPAAAPTAHAQGSWDLALLPSGPAPEKQVSGKGHLAT